MIRHYSFSLSVWAYSIFLPSFTIRLMSFFTCLFLSTHLDCGGRSIKSIRSHDTTLKASKSICPHQSQAKGLILSNALWTRLSLPASLTFILKPSHVSIDAEVQANPLMSILYNGSCKVKLASGNDDTSAKYQYMPSLCCWEETRAHAKVVANNPVTKRHQSHLRKCSQHWQHT